MKSLLTALKQWNFVYKLISFIIIFLLILFGLIWGCFIDYWYINPNDTAIAYPRLYNFNVIISFWSVHTNILIMLWFFYALLYHNHEEKNKFTSITSQTTITVYITMTFLLFWGIIVGNILGISEYDFATKTKSDIAITSLTHLLTPLLMIIYYLLSTGNKHISYKKYFIRNIFITFSYPILYCIFLLLRAQLVIGDKVGSFVYPYSFLHFNNPIFGTSLILSNFVCLLSLAILLIAFNLFYIFVNNLNFKCNLKKNHYNKLKIS